MMPVMPMIQAPSPQPAALLAPSPEVALAQLARAALGLVQSAGQPVSGLVVGAAPGGLTQLQIGEMVLAVRLSAPLAEGTAVKLSIAPDGKGQPNLQITPVVAGASPGPARPPVPVATALPPVPTTSATTPPTATPTVAQPAATLETVAAPRPQAVVRPPVPANASAQVLSAMPRTAPSTGPAMALDIQEQAQVGARAPSGGGAIPAGSTAPAAVALPATSPASPAAAPAMPGTAPAAGAGAPAIAASTPAAPVTVDRVGPPQAPGAGIHVPPSAAGKTGGAAAPATVSSVPTMPGIASAARPAQAAAPQAPIPAPAAAQPTMLSPATLLAATATPVVATPSPALPPSIPAQTVATAGSPRPAPPQQSGVAVAIPYRATLAGAAQKAAPSLPLAHTLADPAQAAARQDSIVPLLARLAALGPRLDALPPQAAQAALRLLAMRLSPQGLDGKALQGAVNAAGVLAQPSAGASAAAPTLKSALLQLRTGLSGVPGAAVEAVAPVAGRPHPPIKGDEARAVRAELALPMESEEPARGLLGQTDAALSRLKLLQHASQPPEARPGAPAKQELRVEVPLMIGPETALVQFVVDRDARRRDQPGQRGWRMRFAFASQQTGEVGAEVGLFGPSVSVALWADTPEMEAAMADGLDELRAALLAEGLEAGSIGVRRRAEMRSQQPGALMDSAR